MRNEYRSQGRPRLLAAGHATQHPLKLTVLRHGKTPDGKWHSDPMPRHLVDAKLSDENRAPQGRILLRLSNKLPPIVSNEKPTTRRRKSLTDPDPAGIGGRQIDVHVNVGPVELCENPAACRQDFTDIGDAVFDRAGPRRYERVVGDVDLVERHGPARPRQPPSQPLRPLQCLR